MRNLRGKYQPNTRSIHLQKLKKSKDEEFEIIGYSAPNKETEKEWVIWTCKAKNGKKFNVKLWGIWKKEDNNLLMRKNIKENQLTVKY